VRIVASISNARAVGLGEVGCKPALLSIQRPEDRTFREPHRNRNQASLSGAEGQLRTGLLPEAERVHGHIERSRELPLAEPQLAPRPFDKLGSAKLLTGKLGVVVQKRDYGGHTRVAGLAKAGLPIWRDHRASIPSL
jgi:hypothetical protein